MTLDDTLLQDPANWRIEESFQIYQATQSAWSTTLTATAIDGIGCRLWELSTSRTTTDPIDLQAQAEAIAGRVTGLLEPLRLLEVDAEHGLALCRSTEPTTRQGQRFYTELLVRTDGGVELRRYRAAVPGSPREQVAFTLTHEAIVKLVDDLTR